MLRAKSIERLLPCLSARYRLLARKTLYRPFCSNAKSDDVKLTIPSLNTSFPHRWLRDACRCSSCVHPSTSQKLFRTSDIISDTAPAPDGVTFLQDGVRIKWMDGHGSFYPQSFLEQHSSPSKLSSSHKDVGPLTWNSSSITSAPNLYLPYEALNSPPQFLAAITQLTQYGLLFITGVPNERTSSETCELRALANRFGELRETFYGDLWDVKNVRNSRNIAYTNFDLGLHMDLLYFQHPPRYQILHCLRNRVVGGTSIFVDGFHAAITLRQQHPIDFDILVNTRVPFHYINDGHHLHYEHPTIELDPLSASIPGGPVINHINYAPPFQAPLLLNSTPPAFYDALGRFATLLDDPANRFEYTLREGDAVMFDNRRVLHARTAFSDEGAESEDMTNRWLKGCYLEADAILDRGRVLRAKID
ncbi:Clavaminate synthase-like protein [Leucogyrophana mollusca]|uniref:Clavaminate synthase-like protein n=1 Tax=Leucogyrophana mollusca TaxID=85980 RepID=A0ACB8BW56_9AGAM|nr:Clavaminate synthase-like protein [Leucogyrophana mollusca]